MNAAKSPSTLALVESPAQLLNVLEWAHADAGRTGGLAGPVEAARRPRLDLRAVVLAPTHEGSRAQLRAVAELAATIGVTVDWREVRRGGLSRADALRAVASAAGHAETLVLGDPFSGLVELFVTTARASRIVVVDDGSASVEFAELLASGHTLVRWHLQGRRQLARPLAAAALAKLRSTEVELFTVMPLADSVYLRCRQNSYAWTRSLFPDPVVQPGADLVGTSLVESGVVSEYAYLSAVAALARTHQARHYLAHRRESDTKLRLIERAGLEVVRPELPLELLARRGPVPATLVSFPSTIVHTLPVVLAGLPVEVKVCDVRPDWFTAAASPNSGSFLSGVTESARRRHQVGTASL